MIKVQSGTYTSNTKALKNQSFKNYLCTFLQPFAALVNANKICINITERGIFEDLPCIDYKILEEALFHVFVNAVKFSRRNSEIDIKVWVDDE
jgi:K+-sensing histidine kinase KdpD